MPFGRSLSVETPRVRAPPRFSRSAEGLSSVRFVFPPREKRHYRMPEDQGVSTLILPWLALCVPNERSGKGWTCGFQSREALWRVSRRGLTAVWPGAVLKNPTGDPQVKRLYPSTCFEASLVTYTNRSRYVGERTRRARYPLARALSVGPSLHRKRYKNFDAV